MGEVENGYKGKTNRLKNKEIGVFFSFSSKKEGEKGYLKGRM